jgi:hypothetical protein
MKNIILCFFLCITYTISIHSQEFYPIVVNKKGLGKVYTQNEQKLKNKELNLILKNDSNSAAMYKKSRTNDIIATSALAVGTVPLIGSIVAGSNDELGVSLGLSLTALVFYVTALPFSIKSSKQKKEAINLYNSQPTEPVKKREPFDDVELKIGMTSNGIGLVLLF